MNPSKNFVYTEPFYWYKPGRIKQVYHVVPWPFNNAASTTALHILSEVNQNAGEYRVFKIEYKFPSQKTKPVVNNQNKRNHAR
jgi:hypothetical protein